MNNRKIKFRFWHKSANQFLYFEDPDIEINDGYGMFLVPIKDYSSIDCDGLQEKITFQQFTGLKDKNEIDVYEGDLIEYKFDDTSFKCIIKWENFGWVMSDINDEGCIPLVYIDTLQVVGNVFENSELLSELNM